MTKDEAKKIAVQRGIENSAIKNLKKTDLIRLIQIQEGNEACYMTDKAAVCGQDNCLWRSDCK
jgi:hypothetical protein